MQRNQSLTGYVYGKNKYGAWLTDYKKA
jgi:hypothetical protein